MSKIKRKKVERCTIYDGCPDGWIYDENIDMSIILPARLIPDGSIVTKKTGTKEYILQSSIKIVPYVENGDEFIKNDPVEVVTDGSLFMVDKNNPYYGFETINEYKQLRWIMDEDDFDTLFQFFRMREDGVPQ